MLVDVSEYSQERKGFWYEADDIPTSETVALEAWVRVAHDVLSRTAETYHAVVREAEFAEELQATSGIRTTRPYGRWLDKVLGPLGRYCDATGEPPLALPGGLGARRPARPRGSGWSATAGPARLPLTAASRLPCRSRSTAGAGSAGAAGRSGEARTGTEAGRQDRPARRRLPDVLHGHPRDRGLRQLRVTPGPISPTNPRAVSGRGRAARSPWRTSARRGRSASAVRRAGVRRPGSRTR